VAEQEFEETLAGHSFFKGLEAGYLELLARCATNREFASGEYIFRQGEIVNEFYLIRQGRVALEVHAAHRGPVTIQTLGKGDLLGISWLVSPYRALFDVRAAEITRTASIYATCLREKCEDDPRLGYELLKRFAEIMVQRLQATRLQLLDVYGHGPSGERTGQKSRA
jgi:CRP/FNR family cyclic AMP-dependent transcriptional regulator